MALGLTGAHEVWVKLMSLHRGSTPLTESQTSSSTVRGNALDTSFVLSNGSLAEGDVREDTSLCYVTFSRKRFKL